MTGGTGNDTFNSTNGTLTALDTIAGGAGTDTLNLIDTSTANFALPVGTVISGLETVNVIRQATGGGTGVFAITNTSFGTGVTSLIYTDSSLAASMTGATAAVTLNSATAVTVASTSTGVFTTVAVTDTSTTTASIGRTLATVSITGSTGAGTLTGSGITTLNLSTATGVQTVTAAAGTRALTVNVSGTSGGGETDATATTLTINSTVTAAGAVGTFTNAAATTVNYNTTTANGAGALVITAAAATTLNVGGSAVATLTLTGSTALTTVNVSGTAGLTVDLTAVATAVTALNFTNTAGTSTVTLNTGTAVSGGAGVEAITVAATTKAITLGDGNDSATVSVTALGTGGSISGGNGTDELILTNANAVTLSTAGAVQTAFRAAVTGFETLNIGTQSNSTVSATSASATGITTIKMTSAAQPQILSNVTSGQTIEMVYGAAGTSVTANALTSATDSLTVKLGGDLSAAARVFGIFATPGTETVNIVMSDTNTTFTTRQATATLNDSAATSIIVTGNNGLTLTHQLDDNATASTNLTNLNASGLTKGAIIYTSGVLTTDATVVGSLLGGDTLNFGAATSRINMTATAGTNALSGALTFANTITGGSGIDTITGGSAVDTIVGGAGADVIIGRAGADVLTGGLGIDDFRMVTGIANGTDSIADFTRSTNGDIFTVSVGATGISALKDGNAAAVGNGAAVGVREISAATALVAGNNIIVLTGATFATAALAQTAIEAGGSRALTFNSATTAADDIILVWSDGTLGHISLVNIASAATTITAANATIADAATLVGVTSIGAGDFVAGNFVFIT